MLGMSKCFLILLFFSAISIVVSVGQISPIPPTPPDEFDGNYSNWEFKDSNSGYGFFADNKFPYFTFEVTGNIESLSTNREIFDHLPFESLFGDADNVENFRLQSMGTAFLNIVFSTPIEPKSLGIAVTDLDLDDVILKASYKGQNIENNVINRWFRETFDSKGTTNKPSWDTKNNAVVAQWDEDGVLSDETFVEQRGSESASAWFFPDILFDSLSFEYRNRDLNLPSSMHVFIASKIGSTVIDIDADIKLVSDNKVRIFLPVDLGDFSIQSSTDLQQWKTISDLLSSDTFNTDRVLNYLFEEKQHKKAFVPTEDIGNDWVQLNYDDSNWLDVESVSEDGTLVRGGVGFARSGTRVDPFDPFIALDLEEQMYTISASVYIRIPFTIDDLSEVDSLILAARTDDGFVAWINGEKVQSFKAPDEPKWDSVATASNLDSIAITLREFPLDNHIDKLRVGQNIIAIQALNYGKSASDFLFSCVLGVPKQQKYFSIDYPITIPTTFYRIIK